MFRFARLALCPIVLVATAVAGCVANSGGGSPGTTSAGSCRKTACDVRHDDCLRYRSGSSNCDSCSSLCSGSGDFVACAQTCLDNCTTASEACNYDCSGDTACVDAFDRNAAVGDPDLLDACSAANRMAQQCGYDLADCTVASRVLAPSMTQVIECASQQACGAALDCETVQPDSFGDEACAQCPDQPFCSQGMLQTIGALDAILNPTARAELHSCLTEASCEDAYRCVYYDLGSLYPALAGN